MSSPKKPVTTIKIGWAFAGCLLLLLAASHLPLMHRLDFFWLDTLTHWRAMQREPPSDIVLIDIDTYSIEAMAPEVGAWPWPRATHAYLLEWLNEQGAKAIVFDIWFSEASLYLKEMDSYFAEVLANHDNIYMPTLLYSGEAHNVKNLAERSRFHPFIEPTARADNNAKADVLWPALGQPEHWRLGLINFLSEPDGIGRQYHVHIEKNGWRFFSLPAIVARDFAYPLPEHSPIRLDWFGKRPPIQTLSYHDVFQQVKSGAANSTLKDKFVFIGSTATGNHDLKPTALDSQYPAVYMLITAFDNLRSGEQLHWSPWYAVWAGLPALLLMWLVVVAELSYWRVVAAALVMTAALVVASFLGIHQAVLIPIISPLLVVIVFLFACAVLRYLQARDERKSTVELFGRFLDKNVVQQLIDSGLTETSQLAQERVITVLFSDIRGFTTLSEQHNAATIMRLLNQYFTTQVDVIFKHQGTLDKFIGDAIMAFWGAPLDDAKHAEHAIQAAMDMSDALDAFCREQQLTGFDIGIGIHTGPAVIGMLGAQQRMDYTAIGDTVNLASRLEGLTKGVARILVSEATRASCPEAFDFVPHGEYKVKGRSEAVRVFEPRSTHR
ncbi:adenylate/guanylate cyclase domain-containing protein [Permianibacter aggregans]|uniref:Adenylate cyclase n=1 Tax=Permianibacter aggregans TaxID=1510150 RepID=A0A4R6USD0_9GAMM|nr:adenylate/guanylate cyclase domain-containing protein [Permianibacter aggregans]QGX38372.1 adenylate/guanylate cyclase domain-containing protein [Permianibacter aggregans]TDQ48699.1 adenylate cyclase [Permianibacter aggregans]